MAGQPKLSPFLTFDVNSFSITDPGFLDVTVIESTVPFSLNVGFVFGGSFAHFLLGLGLNCNVTVGFESLGAGPEGTLGPLVVTTNVVDLIYTGIIPVAPGTLTAGSYRLVGNVVIPGSGIAGFIDGNILEII